MERHASKSCREPSHSPDFVKVALIVLLTILAMIIVARFIVGVIVLRYSVEGGNSPSLDTLSSVTACLLLHRNGQSGGA
jgi:hypothetical protein